ncbi:nucleotidyltransferase family protein [Arsukibacterium indicum]|uniref:Nucleotidyltransferase family protein n=1 Tax=Arsukibacterium indicum TaxID=2848612 RepID=A0ABS6ML18_9GAMM|nr:nucleotidyltransferase family protein [Arsukibacterium indicum]MBV2129509.1 nucleotidyltransferase family protein [Arsukibacterium indicum]
MLVPLLIQCFRDPLAFQATASADCWTRLLQDARSLGMTAQLKALCERHQLWDRLPATVQKHFAWGWRYYQKQQASLFYELMELEPCLQQANYPCLLLKGAAYQALGLTVSEGRLYSDIDLLIDRYQLDDCKSKLFFAGFFEPAVSAYDKYFYLQLSHENPPLYHVKRGTALDIHFALFPLAGRKKLATEQVFASARPIEGSCFQVPSLSYLYIHAAIHFFWQEEQHKLVKDLIDLDLLYSQLLEQNLLAQLLIDAEHFGALEPTINTLLLVQTLFKRCLPADIAAQITSSPYQRSLARALVIKQLGGGISARLAGALWYLRGYQHKMHWRALLRHIWVKGKLAWQQRGKQIPQQNK